MHRNRVIGVVAAIVICSGGAVLADWDPGDPNLFSQLPDPTGWDIYSEWQYGVADDWTATTTVPITDIHFWGSWKNDVVGSIGNLLIQIFDNDTSGSFPKPGNQLWQVVIPEGSYQSRLYDEDWQGWFDPRGYWDDYDPQNHRKMFQYNITPDLIENPFVQQAGETYWLQISAQYEGCEWGWKTSTQPTGASAVFWDKWGYHGWNWQKLKEPGTWYEPIGMAFVLTPEPTTLLLLACGAAMVLRKRRK